MTSASPKYGEGVLSIEQRMLAAKARISVNGTRLNLGSFDNIEDAAKAYQRAAIENFGPFVRSEQ